ncbi:MAG: hypothetical protein WKF33_11140, partial [Thermoleophilaceae bacterium]
RLREAGAAASLVSGSGPTVVGAFADPGAAARAAVEIEGAIVTGLGSVAEREDDAADSLEGGRARAATPRRLAEADGR